MLRLFIAVPLAPGIGKKLSIAQHSLARAKTRVTWVDPESMHITIKFIGDYPASEIGKVRDMMAASLVGCTPSRLHFAGLSFFPNEKSPRVIKVDSTDESGILTHAHNYLDKALCPLGVPSENRRFTPHITLGRLKNTADIGTLVRIAQEYQDFKFGSMDVSSLTLFASKLDRNGPKYTVLDEIDCE